MDVYRVAGSPGQLKAHEEPQGAVWLVRTKPSRGNGNDGEPTWPRSQPPPPSSARRPLVLGSVTLAVLGGGLFG